ncbi:guanido phosphotransferase [Brachyspira alvinipulli]|uniref:guanido phosphotransferase n=1 Tax=Brachyspira alvinipulli TaxID=84379 RepID=UPI000480C994|nr:guanido phosphotransferase [Brachyspira alvinipulli]
MSINNIANWIYEKGTDDNIVLYSKVSIYRNIDNMRFFYNMDKDDFEKVNTILKPNINDINLGLTYSRILDLSALDIRILIENLTVPKERNLLNASLYTDINGYISILINSNQHLEIQTIARGLELERCFDSAYKIENMLDKKVDFAYDKKFGYLTSSPNIIGISMNLDVCMAVPCIIWKTPDNIEHLTNECYKLGFDVTIKNGLINIKNNIMLGVTEKFILDSIINKVKEISEKEKKIRNRIKKIDSVKIEDRVYRSRAILSAARTLKYRELINHSLWLRVGLYYGMFDDIELDSLYYMFFLGKNNHLKQLHKKNNHYRNIDEIRANTIRDIMKI